MNHVAGGPVFDSDLRRTAHAGAVSCTLPGRAIRTPLRSGSLGRVPDSGEAPLAIAQACRHATALAGPAATAGRTGATRRTRAAAAGTGSAMEVSFAASGSSVRPHATQSTTGPVGW